jgi:hypothetical protein
MEVIRGENVKNRKIKILQNNKESEVLVHSLKNTNYSIFKNPKLLLTTNYIDDDNISDIIWDIKHYFHFKYHIYLEIITHSSFDLKLEDFIIDKGIKSLKAGAYRRIQAEIYLNPILFTLGNEQILAEAVIHEYSHALCDYEGMYNENIHDKEWKSKYKKLINEDFNNILNIIRSNEK